MSNPQHTPIRRRPDSAFTLIELLVVIAIIAVLGSLSVVGVVMIQGAAKVRRAAIEAVQIVNAMERYRQDFGQWPTQVQEVEDVTYSTVEELKPIYDVLGGSNALERIYITIPEKSYVDGVFIDPWDRPYVISCDEHHDFDTENPEALSVNEIDVTDPDTGVSLVTNVTQKVAVFSWGADPRSDRTKPVSW